MMNEGRVDSFENEPNPPFVIRNSSFVVQLAELFWEFFKISLFVIGGGYSILAVADSVFSRKGWIKEDELLEHLPVFQMVPGLIATHTAVYVGQRVAGSLGSLVGVVAVAIPSVAIFTAVSVWYREIPLDNPWLNSAFVGLRAALTGIIAATVVRSWRKFLTDAFAYALLVAGIVALAVGVPVWAVLVASMACGLMSAGKLKGEVEVEERTDKLRSSTSTRNFNSLAWLPLLYFLQYGALCFGGGFVIVPMYLADFVGPDAAYLQLTSEEFSNIMAVSQMTPGPIGVNCATFFGFRLAGVAGAAIASAMLLLPGSVAAWFVFRSLERFKTSRIVRGILRGVRPASVALMLVALAAFTKMTVVSSDGKFHTVGAALVILTTFTFMKKKLNVILLIVLCALAACVLRAEDQVKVRGEGEQRNVKNSIVHLGSSPSPTIQPSDFPDADSVTVSEIERVEYKPDGTSVSCSEAWSKILTERGRREESQLTLGYNKRYGTAKILYVGAVGTNGVERAIDVSGTTKDMTDNSSLAENIVDPEDRTLVCTIPGLQVGETVHVKLERSTFKSRIKDQWCDLAVMEWTHPILKSVYEVKAPKERPIRSRAVRHPLGNVTEEVKPLPDGSTLYVYTATNSPRMFPEPDMPPTWTQVQAVHLSTAGDWKELSRWYWDVCEPHLAKTNPAMTNKVEELGRDMKRIFKFVSQEVRYMGLTMEDTSPGYAPHDVDITFDNRYGVCRDKGALLVALLRIAGYRAYPVLINVGAKMDPDVPKPYFNHAIVAVEVDDEVKVRGEGEQRRDANSSVHLNSSPSPKYLLMDPTNENTKDLLPGYLCNCSYLVARPEGEDLQTSPVPPPERNAVDVKTHGKLRDDGVIVLESTLDFTGVNDTIYRGALGKATPEQRVKFFENRVKLLQPGAELVKCDIVPENMQDTTIPLHVALLAKLPETVLRGATEDALAVPFVSRAFSIANWLLGGNTSLEERRYPLVIDTTAQVRESVEIDLGTALGAVKALPEATALTNAYCFLRSFAVSNGTLRAERTHTIRAVEFSPEAYAKMREDIKAVEAVERKNPVFVADALKNANVHRLLESTDVDIASDTAWTVTNTIVKEVLTYKGKKDSAEMSFSYNPTWKHVTVLSATVSNLNGIVSHVKPVEMNEMDAGWAAAAPRYPAGKTLIVNLPAVEVGSVISVTTVTTVTNAPASYYGAFGFDAKEPLVRRRVRVTGLRGLRSLKGLRSLRGLESADDSDVWERDVVNPKRVPDEPSQPAAHLWRDVQVITKNDFAKAAETLRLATDVEPLDPSVLTTPQTSQTSQTPQTSQTSQTSQTIQSLRDWMAKHVRIAGPSLYEVPIAQQLTDPATVIAERYATRLDYIRTLCALLKGAGYDADIVFAAQNAALSEEARRRDKYELPNVRAFATAVCRVRETTGGFLGFGGETKTYFLGTENEYTPLETTALEGCDFFDPEAEAFGRVTAMPLPAELLGMTAEDIQALEWLAPKSESEVEISVRENGAIDYKYGSKLWGAGVGAFRKLYAEILPEDFSRHYQELLGSVAKAASATKELTPDIASYPAALSFECYVPDYATVEGDTITLKLPPFDCPVPALPGSVRETPVALGSQERSSENVTVRFPAGYTEIEHVPECFAFPSGVLVPRMRNAVSAEVVDGCLEVSISRDLYPCPSRSYSADNAELFRDWRRRATSLASRTIVVRKAKK